MPSKVITIAIQLMFLGINIFWALLRAHFSSRLTARAIMSLSQAQNIFMPANINSIVFSQLGQNPFSGAMNLIVVERFSSQPCHRFLSHDDIPY